MALRLGLKQVAAARRVLSRPFSSFQHAADKLVIEIPDEHDGLNIEFNWSLAQDDVAPHGDAYRNLKWPKLQAFAADAKPAGKKIAAIQEVDVDIPFAAFEETYEQVTKHLSLEEQIFTQDGAVGSFKDDRTRVRVISDSPLVALFAQNLLVRVPIKDPHAVRPIVVYVASKGDFAAQEPQALLLIDRDEDDSTFAKVVITGTSDLASIMNAISLAKTKLMEANADESIALPCDVVMEKDKSALVFNASDAMRSNAVQKGKLYAAHWNIWNAAGVTSLFGGAIVNQTDKKQALAIENGVSAVSVPCNNLVNHPSAAFFVQKSTSGLKSIAPEEAAKLMSEANSGIDVEKVTSMLKTANTKTYVVANEADVDAALAKL